MNFELICNQVCALAKETGSFIRLQKDKISNENIETKGIHNYVTFVDTTSEEMIVAGLQKILPEAGFITEEETNVTKGDVFNWVIDPLDGTTNFIHGMPPFAISIALMQKDEVIVGVVYEVMLDECFYAWKEGGAFLNGKKISVSSKPTVSDSLIATGFPYHDYHRIQPFLQTLDYFMRNSHGIRRIGSAATDLAYVACGRFEAFYEYSLNPWDVAAGAFIVQRAGGKVSDFTGGSNYIFGKEIVAANSLVHNEFLGIVKKIMC